MLPKSEPNHAYKHHAYKQTKNMYTENIVNHYDVYFVKIKKEFIMAHFLRFYRSSDPTILAIFENFAKIRKRGFRLSFKLYYKSLASNSQSY